MSEYLVDLDEIAKRVQRRQNDYDVMRYQLQLDDDVTDEHLDAFITRISVPILAGIDCTKCGNCCRALDVYLEESDVERLAQGIHVRIDDIMNNYVDYSVAQSEGEWGKFQHKPCAFLRDTVCSVYEHRPQTCRDYPFLTPDFRWGLDDLIDGAHICPIIFNTLEVVLKHVDEIVRGEI
jgi:uncharacterized protein